MNRAQAQPIGNRGRRRPAGPPAKPLEQRPFAVKQYRVIKVVAREHLVPLRRPAHPTLIQKIARYLQNLRLNQYLGRRSVQVLDQLQNLREEMDIGRDEQRIAALVRHDAHLAHQIAHLPIHIAPVGRALVILLPAQPREIPFFLRFLFQSEAALRRAGLLLLLLRLWIGLLRLLTCPAGGRRTTPGKQNVDAIGHDRRFGKIKPHPQRGFTRC